ncbi:phage antirepressor KilAC domain-containing protein [Pantoea septica]|uniref:phage antirepressor KilAC domain-containing protein n=1 Tax=Pantoea septica TaxID=472695 RepID=UPI0028D529BE|nr:phage antirepressor KilAC domain-containing protein [Pantoea septica]
MQYPVNDQSLTMTSREIAEVTGKRHPDVKRDIETMMEQLQEDVSKFARIYLDSMNRKQTEYVLDREHTECLVTGYSALLRMKVIKRMHELEESVRIPQTLPEALRLAADLAEQKAELESKLAIAAPKADFVDSYVEASGSMGFREAAKLLKVKETEFRLFLIDNGIMYRLAGKLTPYAQHLDAGRFTVKTGENLHNGHAFTQVKFTPKGIQWIAGLLAAANMQGAA